MLNTADITRKLRILLRRDIGYADFMQDMDLHLLRDNAQGYAYGYTLDDMIALIGNLLGDKPDKEAFARWLKLVFADLEDLYEFTGTAEIDPSHASMGLPYPVNDAAMARYIFFTFHLENYHNDDLEFDLPLMLEDIRNQSERKPIHFYLWSKGNKLLALQYAKPDKLRKLNSDDKAALRQLMSDMAAQGEPTALKQLGYSCYGGDELFACDWPRARDCFLRLMDSDGVEDYEKCGYANTLGYIFYYGRCNGGVPEYDKAFKYFSIGAAGGFYESIYKLSDMYIHGYYVSKNTYAAQTLTAMVFDENAKRIMRGDFGCKFADAALRMGNLCRDGIIKRDALYYYTLADFAIRRRLPYDHYGDSNVFAGIQEALAKAREERPLEQKSALRFSDVPPALLDIFEKYSCRVTLKPLKKSLQISVERLPHPGEEEAEGIFEIYTDVGYCDLTDHVRFTAYGKNLPQVGTKLSFIANDLVTDKTDDGIQCVFTLYDDVKLALNVEYFMRRLPAKERRKAAVYDFASVVFSPGGKSYDYICEIDDVSVGDHVIVLAHDEEKEVEVVRLFKMSVGDMPLPPERYKKILRKV